MDLFKPVAGLAGYQPYICPYINQKIGIALVRKIIDKARDNRFVYSIDLRVDGDDVPAAQKQAGAVFRQAFEEYFPEPMY
jgi:hypothetical protein